MHVLVIDDSRVMRAVITRMLTPLGHECITAINGRDALTVLEQSAPVGLALVDWNMPVMNGLEFVRTVRADPRYASMKIMMVTSEVEVDRISAALDLGATEYLMKPFTPEALLDKLTLMGLDQAA